MFPPHFHVPDTPILSPLLQMVVAPVGRDFTIPCGDSVVANPWPQFEWDYNGRAVAGSTVRRNGDLMLPAVTFNQSGDYTCLASNIIGNSNITILLLVASELINQ